MAQPIAPEVWNRAVKENNPKLLPNKKTRELFKGNGGIKINPQGGVCRIWDMQISDYITTYDDRRINGLMNLNSEGHDGWGASAYGVFQNVYFNTEVFGMSRHRSLAYRLFEEYQYTGDIGEWGGYDASGKPYSNYTSGGQALIAVAQQMSEVKSRVEEEVIGPDMDGYNMYAACNGKINGRVVAKPGYDDNVFDGDCEHYDWVPEPGPFGGTPLPPKFAPIMCMELDFNDIYPMLHNLRNAWNAARIPFNECSICIDPDYSLKLQQVITGQGIPILESTKKMMEDGPTDGFKLNGFQFDFTVDPQMFPWLYVDTNLNVCHSPNANAPYDKYINSITPAAGDKNPFRTRLIASYRMGVQNYVRTIWNSTILKFEKQVTNYPLGEVTESGYYGEKAPVPFENYNKPSEYPHEYPNAGKGLPAADEVPVGWTGPTATGPQAPITKRKVVGLAIYPKAVALSQEYSGIVTDEGKTRGKFTEMCWDVKYDCWVLPQYSLGVVPILDIDDDIDFAVPTSAKVKNATHKNAAGDIVTDPIEIAGSSATAPVFTKEVTTTNAAKKTKAKK